MGVASKMLTRETDRNCVYFSLSGPGPGPAALHADVHVHPGNGRLHAVPEATHLQSTPKVTQGAPGVGGSTWVAMGPLTLW